jgi:hypothetical protein
MLWLKRNLFLALGGLVALGLLGYGVYFLLGAVSRMNELAGKLEENSGRLRNVREANPFPHTTNIATARAEIKRTEAAVGHARKFLAPIPYERLTDLPFRQYRDTVLSDLQKAAERAGTGRPARPYAFSFESIQRSTQFTPASFPVLCEQLAEVKALCLLIYGASVNSIENVRRARLTVEDQRGTAVADYHDRRPQTNDLAGTASSYYEVTFLSFGEELARVIDALQRSPHGLLIRGIVIEPHGKGGLAGDPFVPGGSAPPPGGGPPPGPPPGQGGLRRPGVPPPGGPGRPPPGVAPVPGAVSRTVLIESMLRTTLLVEVVKSIR